LRVTEPASPYGDPLTAPFWEAATRRTLVVQRCRSCGHHQFYPRPFCLSCESPDVVWVETVGIGTIYSMTTVHMQVSPEFEPPYVVAIVQLDEGPRLLTTIVGGRARIGERVRVAWRDRDGAPPLPVFRVLSPVEGAGSAGATAAASAGRGEGSNGQA
jgi:uncharacterized OB-fold protein